MFPALNIEIDNELVQFYRNFKRIPELKKNAILAFFFQFLKPALSSRFYQIECAEDLDPIFILFRVFKISLKIPQF